MKINKSLRSKIALGLLVGGLSVPMMTTESFAAPMARPSVRVSTPRASIPRVSTPKVSSPKPSSIKPGASTMKPSKPITNSSKPKSSTSTPKSNTSTTPKKTVTRTPKAPTNYTRPSYINNYSSTGSGYSRDLNFWRLYGITHMISGNRNPSEREIAEELAKKGYSESEVKKIMKEAEKEQKTKKEKSILMGITALILVGVGAFFLFILLNL